MLVRVYTVLSLLLIASDGANILSVLPSSSRSHFIYPNALLLELAASGHNVTVISPFSIEKPRENYKTIDISDMKKEFERRVDSLFASENMQMNLITKFKFLYENTLHMANITLQHPKMKELMKSDEKFDLIILDLFLTDALLGLSTIFDCPVIALSSNGPHTWVNDVLGSPRPASFVPHMYTDFTERMNLGRRLEDEVFYYIEKIFMNIYHLPQQEKLFNEVFPNSRRSFDEVRSKSVAVTLVNSHYSFYFPKHFLPNTIEVPGMQINEAVSKPLPDDIREFIENSEHGVIYFSLGGSAKASSMDSEKVQDLIEAFSRLKLNTIWKHDNESLNVDPSKIMVRKWLPQFDILGHDNTKIFITHASLPSSIEAIHFAKNVIAVPIVGNQPKNAKKFAKAKLGIHLNYLSFTGKTLTWAVGEILSNPIYSQSMKEASHSFREKPLTALETGKFWVEYVLQNKNVSNIRSARLGSNSHFELRNFDVYLIIFAIVMLLLAYPFCCLKNLYFALRNRIAGSSKSKTN